MKETLKDKCKLYSPGDLPDVDQLVPGTPKKGDNVFLILDDLIADLERNKELLRRVTRYAIFGRKKHVTMVFLSQNFYAGPVTVRRQMNRLMICGMTSTRDTKPNRRHRRGRHDAPHAARVQVPRGRRTLGPRHHARRVSSRTQVCV